MDLTGRRLKVNLVDFWVRVKISAPPRRLCCAPPTFAGTTN
jgi:hypothetical protein